MVPKTFRTGYGYADSLSSPVFVRRWCKLSSLELGLTNVWFASTNSKVTLRIHKYSVVTSADALSGTQGTLLLAARTLKVLGTKLVPWIDRYRASFDETVTLRRTFANSLLVGRGACCV